ncbi:benzodiazepine receptor family protein-like protein [Lineolata rhizophorae]|uniref:Benzodiazepine receptor family protein-like protein n=1 Tax=Lineolata rhizophorae TaxID=578093 RepID=A0A6A6P7Z3_9PEZI|nr:benzodiazepine receptor family protein-like protein [Lineolata rhizophorae]
MTTHISSITLPAFVFEKPAVSLLLPVVLGNAVGLATRLDPNSKAYKSLKQPPLNPPPYVFGPVWTALYLSMGYASYRAWNAGMSSLDMEKVKLAKDSATLYTIQLGMNLVWMPLFFALRRPIEATVDIVALTGAATSLACVYGRIDTVAGWMLAPYVAWLGFASYLSAGCGYLNNWNFTQDITKDE